LRYDPKEAEDFIGLDGDGRAPVGSFGARIQLAYLLGLIEKPRMQVLRLLKDIRNLFSHRVAVSFEDERVVSKIKALINLFADDEPVKKHPQRTYSSREEFLEKVNEFGATSSAYSGFYIGAATIEIKQLTDACRRRKGKPKHL
jgi:hypothetical protein